MSLRKVIDDSVNDIRKEIESDMGDLTERVSEISDEKFTAIACDK